VGTTTDWAEPPPPPVLYQLVEAASTLPEARRRGPFRGLGGGDGLTVEVGRRAVFLSDEDMADLIAGDYAHVSATGAGDGELTLLARAFAAYVRDRAG
jgi:hypothetical protein